MISPEIPYQLSDPINAQILAISEDRIVGFHTDPLDVIARLSRVDYDVVRERIVAMMQAGTIRRVRQTLMATNLAHGALIAWEIPPAPSELLNEAFDFLWRDDPFSGHIVIRSTDGATAGSKYRLWTTLKVPQGYSLEKHCSFLAQRIGAVSFRIMPAKRLFVLGVGHVRRRGLEPGSKSPMLADALEPEIVTLNDLDWRVLMAIKRELDSQEIAESSPQNSIWAQRAAEAQVPLDSFNQIAQSLSDRGVIGRFSTFLEHVKPLKDGERVTRFNALFHWAVPEGREIEAGREVGRFHIMTHAYWREGGPEFAGVNVMGVAHGTDKALLLAHKAAIDAHLAKVGIPIGYTNVFWGGRSEIKPSEVAPLAYAQWCTTMAGVSGIPA